MWAQLKFVQVCFNVVRIKSTPQPFLQVGQSAHTLICLHFAWAQHSTHQLNWLHLFLSCRSVLSCVHLPTKELSSSTIITDWLTISPNKWHCGKIYRGEGEVLLPKNKVARVTLCRLFATNPILPSFSYRRHFSVDTSKITCFKRRHKDRTAIVCTDRVQLSWSVSQLISSGEEEEDINKKIASTRVFRSKVYDTTHCNLLCLPLLDNWKRRYCLFFSLPRLHFVSIESSSSSSIDILPQYPSACAFTEERQPLHIVCCWLICAFWLCGDCPIDILRSFSLAWSSTSAPIVKNSCVVLLSRLYLNFFLSFSPTRLCVQVRLLLHFVAGSLWRNKFLLLQPADVNLSSLSFSSLWLIFDSPRALFSSNKVLDDKRPSLCALCGACGRPVIIEIVCVWYFSLKEKTQLP